MDGKVFEFMTDNSCSHPKVWYGLFGTRVICSVCNQYIDPNEVTEDTIISHEQVDEDEWYWEEVDYEDFRKYFKSLGLIKNE